MKASLRWLSIGSLVMAGLISLFYSVAISFSILFDLFPNQSPRVITFAFFLPVILGFPVYLLAVFVSKRFCLALWSMGVIDYGLELHDALRDFTGSHAELLNLVMTTFVKSLALALLIPAVLVQFGTRFYQPHSSSFMARMRRNQA
jgi:hypothetical protein